MAKVELHGLRGHEQRFGRLAIRDPFGHEQCDLEFLWRQMFDGAIVRGEMLSGHTQLRRGAPAPWSGA